VALYQNGTAVAQTTEVNNLSASILNSEWVSIGGESDGGGSFNGIIGPVAVFNRALSANEMRRFAMLGGFL